MKIFNVFMFRISLIALVLIAGVSVSTSAADNIDASYFSRNARYAMLKDKVVLVERDRPGMATMDEWPQLVFLSADGQHKVSELISVLGSQYQGGPPAGFAEQTRTLVKQLAQRGYVVLHAEKRALPYYLAIPVEQQDKNRAKALMEADGFIKKAVK